MWIDFVDNKVFINFKLSGVGILENNIKEMWEEILQESEKRLEKGAADIWLRTCIPIALEDNTLFLDVPNIFVKEQISSRFLNDLVSMVKEHGFADRIEMKVGTETRKDEQERAEKAVKGPLERRTELNANYVFSNFVVGKSNRLAHAASLAVAETPGEAYNPLFIWGGVGLGKTHLMHAIGHYFLDNHKNDNMKVTYVSSEKFTNELISSIKNNRTQEFKAKYRNVDILLIDDIHFLAKKESTQEEFFHTFNSLHNSKKQIVISSDRPPKEIQSIEDRLVSRFEWGLVTDIQPPDYETRVAILQKKAQTRNVDIPEEIILFLANNVPSNIRELEGSLNRVIASSELNSEPMTVENVSVWLKDVIKYASHGPVSVETIQQIVAENLGFTVEDLKSSKRTSELAFARQVAMYLSRKHTESSLQQIGLAFNKKDHTTVLHAQKKIDALIKDQPRIKSTVDNLEEKL
jgi:chromosomal replication initiator protein